MVPVVTIQIYPQTIHCHVIFRGNPPECTDSNVAVAVTTWDRPGSYGWTLCCQEVTWLFKTFGCQASARVLVWELAGNPIWQQNQQPTNACIFKYQKYSIIWIDLATKDLEMLEIYSGAVLRIGHWRTKYMTYENSCLAWISAAEVWYSWQLEEDSLKVKCAPQPNPYLKT